MISIIGPGMKVVGDCHTDGTIRVEGTVEGAIRADKAVVIGKQGTVRGDVVTQDAVISGRVEGTVRAESRLELQATCHIEGEVHTRRMQLEEGAVLNGAVHMGEKAKAASKGPKGEDASEAVRPSSEAAERGAEPLAAASSKG
ncbi:MAG TPA: polymer-forming cytoskeletal protein [Longimicrobiales bacterium]|nr:polymer-forming cytoskeletal protein [Longimicrobiales bacterium]